MRLVRAAYGVTAGVTLAAAVLTGVVAPAHAAIGYRLYVSTHPNRSGAVALNGDRVHGLVYVFAKPGYGALRVRFYIDDVHHRKAPVHVETTPPYDLMGGSPKHPGAFHTATLANGKHTISIVVEQPNKQRSTYTATFTIANPVKPPPAPTHVKATAGKGLVTVTWHSGGGRTAGFFVYRGSSSHVSLHHPVSSRLSRSARSFVDYSVTSGKRYYYVVQAVASTQGRAASKGVRSGTVKAAAKLSLASVTAVGGSGAVRLTWAAKGAASIRVYRATSSVTLHSHLVKTLSGAATHFSDTTVSNGTTYHYLVQALAGTKHVESASVEAVPVAAPTSVTATGGPTGVTLGWSLASTAGETGIAVYRSTTTPVALTGPLATLAAGVTTYTDASAAVGTTYYYVVSAQSAAGHAEGGSGAATPVAAPVVGTAGGDGTVTLHWTAGGTGVTGYEVFSGATTSAATITSGSPLASLPASTGTYVDSGLTDGVARYYLVRALSAGGQADSTVHGVTPVAAPTVTPSVDTHGQVHLTWTSSNEPPVTSYLVFRGINAPPTSTSSTSAYAKVAAGTTTWADPGTGVTQDDGTTYYYVVQAYYSGAHANSAAVQATPLPSPPSKIVNFEASAGGNPGEIDLIWDSADDLTAQIAIYRSTTSGQLGTLVTTLTDPTLVVYSDTGLASGTTYYYTVRAINPGGHTDSDQASATAP